MSNEQNYFSTATFYGKVAHVGKKYLIILVSLFLNY